MFHFSIYLKYSILLLKTSLNPNLFSNYNHTLCQVHDIELLKIIKEICLSTLLTFSQAGFFISDSNLEYSKLSYTIVNIFHSTSSKIPTINIAPEIPRPIVIGSGGPGGHPEGKIKFITNSVNITLKVWHQAQNIATCGVDIIGFFSFLFCFFLFFFLSNCDKIRLPY